MAKCATWRCRCSKQTTDGGKLAGLSTVFLLYVHLIIRFYSFLALTILRFEPRCEISHKRLELHLLLLS